jgi:hypothetical protein
VVSSYRHPLVNPDNKRAGQVDASHVFFGGCGLQFQAYRRNRFREQEVVGIKTCLRVVAQEKLDRNSFGSLDEHDQVITMEIDGDALLGVHAVLIGQSNEFVHRIVRPGKSPKKIHVKYQADKGNARPLFFISLTDGSRTYATAFGPSTSWCFTMVIAVVLKMQFPSLPEVLLIESHSAMARRAQCRDAGPGGADESN